MTPYKLGESRVFNGVKLRRVVLTKDCKWGKKGDKGGWIEGRKNLQGDAWVYGNAEVCGNAKVYGDARVWGNAKVYGDAEVCGNARVYGNAKVYGDARVWGNAKVYGDAEVCGNARVYGNARVIMILKSGIWDKSPVQIIGTKHPICTPTKTTIKIGCKELTPDEWLKDGLKYARKYKYSNDEISEYRTWIKEIKKRL